MKCFDTIIVILLVLKAFIIGIPVGIWICDKWINKK